MSESLAASFVTVRVTLYVPGLVYVWVGFCSVEVPPSPNAHDHAVGLPLEASVNATCNGDDPDVGDALNDADGGGGGETDTKLDRVTVSDPPALLAVNVTVNVPDDRYVCVGCCSVDVEPSPKSHAQLVGAPVDVSVNDTTNGACPDVGAPPNDATGGGGSA